MCECKECGEWMSIPDELDPTDYCNPCAQAKVITLQSQLAAEVAKREKAEKIEVAWICEEHRWSTDDAMMHIVGGGFSPCPYCELAKHYKRADKAEAERDRLRELTRRVVDRWQTKPQPLYLFDKAIDSLAAALEPKKD